MEVPNTIRALWAQRKRWARGQGEVLHRQLRDVSRWRNRRMWLLSIESVASLLWVIALASALVLATLSHLFQADLWWFGFGLAWGVAITVVATVQLLVAIVLRYQYDRWGPRALLVGAIYPLLFWLFSAAAALHSQTAALVRGPRERRVVWDIPREIV
jgi:biofilm PGA synthesis N-glycosyltransferase PgaC